MATWSRAGSSDDVVLGRSLIASGKVGCIVLAGGDGSRLGWKGPKGTFPISNVKRKTLFELLAERVDAVSNAAKKKLPIAVMTSPLNRQKTARAVPSDFDLFDQELVPLLDTNQNPLKEWRPNGNGDVLKQFYASGLYEKWKAKGVEYIQIILIDNPLAEPFDPSQVGIHFKKRAEITVKAIEKRSFDDNLGAIGLVDDRVRIIEYSENPPHDWKLGNTSLFCFEIDFVEKVKDLSLPKHFVKRVFQGKPVYKTETFIFDLLPYAEKVEVIVYEREETFAPLKERGDIEPVQRALLQRDRRAFQKLTGAAPPDQVFELDAKLHFPTPSILSKWKGKFLPNDSYIEP